MRIGSRIGLMAAAAVSMFGLAVGTRPTPPPAPSRNPRRRHRQIEYVGGGSKRTTLQQTTRIRERARRLRQIERGQLRAENGLVL